jgi:hypothetical protein
MLQRQRPLYTPCPGSILVSRVKRVVERWVEDRATDSFQEKELTLSPYRNRSTSALAFGQDLMAERERCSAETLRPHAIAGRSIR